MSVQSFFAGIGQKIGGLFGSSTPAPAPAAKVTTYTPAKSSVPIPTAKPAYTPAGVATSSPSYSSGGFSLSGIGDFFKQAASTVGSGVEAFFGAKAAINQAKTAAEIENIKLQAVTQSAKQASMPTQIMLPSFSDWLNNPREAASMVTPAALSGSGVLQTGSTALVWILGGAVAIFALTRK